MRSLWGGDQTEPKGRLGLNVLASGVPDVRRGTDPRNVDLSCTKDDLRLPSRGMPGFVLGINSQLVEIDSSRRLSQIVRNLASPNIVVTVLWNMMVRMIMELQYLLWLLLYAFKWIYRMFGTE